MYFFKKPLITAPSENNIGGKLYNPSQVNDFKTARIKFFGTVRALEMEEY